MQRASTRPGTVSCKWWLGSFLPPGPLALTSSQADPSALPEGLPGHRGLDRRTLRNRRAFRMFNFCQFPIFLYLPQSLQGWCPNLLTLRRAQFSDRFVHRESIYIGKLIFNPSVQVTWKTWISKDYIFPLFATGCFSLKHRGKCSTPSAFPAWGLFASFCPVLYWKVKNNANRKKSYFENFKAPANE